MKNLKIPIANIKFEKEKEQRMFIPKYLKQTGENELWQIRKSGLDFEQINYNEAVFTVGNGYLGTRGSFEEGIKGDWKGTYIAGIFDNNDSTVTELVNCPDWTDISIWISGEKQNVHTCKILKHKRCLDLKTGSLFRLTRFLDTQGRITTYQSVRYASMEDKNLFVIVCSVRPENYSGVVSIVSGIEGRRFNFDRKPVYDDKLSFFHPEVKWEKWTRSRHLQAVSAQTNSEIYLKMKTLQSNHQIGYLSQLKMSRDDAVNFFQESSYKEYERVSQKISFNARKGQAYEFEKLVAIYTSRDVKEEEIEASCKSLLKKHQRLNSEQRFSAHCKRWDKKWEHSDCKIVGDKKAAVAIRFNIYHLLIGANESDEGVSIAAKTLSGEGYKGHVFWDTEIFMLPFFIYTQPKVARTLLMYRYNTLDGARQNAISENFRGAKYAWESAADGLETTPKWFPDMKQRIYTGEEEIQITSDICYAVIKYITTTDDMEFFLNYGLEIVLETARFWASRFEYNSNEDRYELSKVIGADEFHQHVNNNAFTNMMAQWNLSMAVQYYYQTKKDNPDSLARLAKKIDFSQAEIDTFRQISERVYIPRDKKSGIYEQHEGYFKLKDAHITEYNKNNMPVFPKGIEGEVQARETKLIKQPDVVMLLYLLPDVFSADEVKKNYDYYERWTMHTSSLSPSIHSIMGIAAKDHSKALQYFYCSAYVDMDDNQKNTEWGIHAASTGGTWMSVVYGFGGFSVKNDIPAFSPWLPQKWESIAFKLIWKGEDLLVKLEHTNITFKLISSKERGIKISLFGKKHDIKPNVECRFDLLQDR